MATQVTRINDTIATPRAEAVSASRIVAIDALRGIALLLMALDHASFFVGAGLQAESYGGQAVSLQSAAYWLSGLLTNLASPIFFLLGGYSLALYAAGQQRKGQREWVTTRYMLVRAAIILVLDLTICSFFWRGDAPYAHVLTALAAAMALLSIFRLLPPMMLAGLALFALLAHQTVLVILADALAAGTAQPFWQAFWITYSYETVPPAHFAVLGWGPLMWLGYALGQQQAKPTMRQPRTWLMVGLGLLGLWLGLRLVGGFGDLGPFGQVGSSPAHFLVMSKAPPSLSYFAFNLGLAALVLAGLYAWPQFNQTRPMRGLVLIGQVSLFVYVTHLIVYNPVAQLFSLISLPGPRIVWGYTAWLVGLAVLVPLAGWYRGMRKRYPKVLSYL
ncbi:MAG: acyltransferase family protein [Oscillochloridaceae bacterium umkhey_bin13]